MSDVEEEEEDEDDEDEDDDEEGLSVATPLEYNKKFVTVLHKVLWFLSIHVHK